MGMQEVRKKVPYVVTLLSLFLILPSFPSPAWVVFALHLLFPLVFLFSPPFFPTPQAPIPPVGAGPA